MCVCLVSSRVFDDKGWLSYLEPDFVKAAKETCPTKCTFTSDRVRATKLREARGGRHRFVDFSGGARVESKTLKTVAESATTYFQAERFREGEIRTPQSTAPHRTVMILKDPAPLLGPPGPTVRL